MKKTIIAIIIIAVLLICGCGAKKVDESEKRFKVEYEQATYFTDMAIIRDTETGKAYLFVKSGYGGGLTELIEVSK